METYIILGKYTQQGIAKIKDGPARVEAVKKAIEAKGIAMASAELTKIPQNTVQLDLKGAESMMKLMDAIEEFEDTQKVYANFDIPADVMAKLEK